MRRAPLALLSLAAVAAPAAAHLPVLRGRLIDLVTRSQLIVIGSARHLDPVGTRLVDVQLTVERVLVGSSTESILTFRAPTGMAPTERYVVFLRKTDAGLECAQPSGTIFPTRPEDDDGYRRTIEALATALSAPDASRIAAVRAALLPALSASAVPLRNHAALELAALARDGHGPTEAERTTLRRLLADPATDPGLRALLARLVAAQ